MSSTFKEMSDTLSRMNARQFLNQAVNFGLIVSSALMIWKTLVILTNSQSPIVVVLSGSMEPGFSRGDLLFLTKYDTPYQTGDIIVFNLDGRDIPIVHRILSLHEKPDGSLNILTKGDNNPVNDRGLYPPQQRWLSRSNIVGRAQMFMPHVGIVTIIMNDYPYLKYSIIAILGLFVLTNKE
eukprot:GCRY01004173.1.p1 GENE.GCRY01004173.1~~GCRY01004173.1.p1  ORF type:complete len:181 (+),score=14.65 GCRY01004173.1:71-613(+)